MNRSSFVSKLFTPVITLLVLAYFGYQIYGYVSDPFSTRTDLKKAGISPLSARKRC